MKWVILIGALSGFGNIGSISDGMGWDGIAYAGLVH